MLIKSNIKTKIANNSETTGRVLYLKNYKLDWKTRWKLFWAKEISIVSLANGDLVLIVQGNKKKTIY